MSKTEYTVTMQIGNEFKNISTSATSQKEAWASVMDKSTKGFVTAIVEVAS